MVRAGHGQRVVDTLRNRQRLVERIERVRHLVGTRVQLGEQLLVGNGIEVGVGSLLGIDGVGDLLCISAHRGSDLALCHVAHRLPLDVDELGIRLKLDLVAAAVLGFVEHAELLEQRDVLLVEHVRGGIHERLQIQKPAPLGFLEPLIGITVAVEDDALVLDQGLAHPCESRLLEIARIFDGFAEALERFRDDRVQNRVGIGEVDLRTGHAELELVSRERERRGAVAVGVVALETGQHLDAEVHVDGFGAVVVLAGNDSVDHTPEFITQEDRDDGRRRLVRAETVVVAGGSDRYAEQVLVVVDRLHDRGQKHEETQVRRGSLAGVEQVLGVGRNRPVVVLARAVDSLERLLVLQAHEPVMRRDRAHELHREQVVVDGNVRDREHGSQLVLTRGNLVVLGLGRHAQLPELFVELLHEVVHRRADGTEVVLLHLLALARRRAEERAPCEYQVLTLLVVLLLDEEVLLLGTDRGGDTRHILAEIRQHLARLRRHGLHRAQERRLLVERLAGVATERRGDAQHLVLDERVARGIPCRIAARLERGANAAGRKTRRIGLALDEGLARKLHDGTPICLRVEERVVLLGRDARQRLEPMRVMRGTVRDGPFLHGVRDHVGDLDVERLALLDRLGQRLVSRRRQQLLHRVVVEHQRAVFLSDSSHVIRPFLAMCRFGLPRR